MSVLKAYTLPHPPLAIPDVGFGKEKEISETLTAMEQVAVEIKQLAPETIIFITPHSTVYADYFHISPGKAAIGDFGRFGVSAVGLETVYDEQLVSEIVRVAEENKINAGTDGEEDRKLDHGVMVPMWYINKHYTNYRSVRISQSGGSPLEHYSLGQAIAKAIDLTGRKVVIVASSDLSHRLKDDGPYGFVPEGAQFDSMFVEALSEGDFLSLFKIPHSLRDAAGECGFNSLMMLAGVLDKQDVKAQLMSYECPFGVGYAVAEFESIGKSEKRDILEQYIRFTLGDLADKREMEDDYVKLARMSLEYEIKTGEPLLVPDGLPSDMMNNAAGVFVSIHKEGMLRGCIGTIVPTTDNIASEIIQNAVSAGICDNRFIPVSVDELKYLVYKVDVLSTPEKISSPDELDVKRYGVIVKSGTKRGLLLPNLDGIDTVKRQIEIAKNKAGIARSEKVELERFEVIRHE